MKRFLFIFVLLGLGSVLHSDQVSCIGASVQVSSLESKVIARLMNSSLQTKLEEMVQGSFSPSGIKEATYPLIAAMEEDCALELIAFLVPYYKERGYKFNVHQVMLKALKFAPSTVVAYLLERGIYDRSYLHSRQQYRNFLFRTNMLHVLYLLFWDSTGITFLPIWVRRGWNIVSLVRFVIWLLGKLFTCFMRLSKRINVRLSTIDMLFSFKFMVLTYLLKVLITLYISMRVSYRPGYMFYLFAGGVSQEAEKKLLLLLRNKGNEANPNERGLLIKRQSELDDFVAPEAREYLGLYSYCSLSILHLAIRHNMAELTEELLERGANVNDIAFSVRDKLDLPDRPEDFQQSKLPFDLVSIRDLYNQRGGKRETCLDMAKKGSRVASILLEYGGKHYEELGAKSEQENKV